jgi:hypothetical protein
MTTRTLDAELSLAEIRKHLVHSCICDLCCYKKDLIEKIQSGTLSAPADGELLEALKLAQEKLKIYRAGSSGAYQGGMEYTALMRTIDAAIANHERTKNEK